MALPETLDLGFVVLIPRKCEGTDLAELVIKAQDADHTNEGVTQMTDFIDRFLEFEGVQNGFAMVYDMRSLRVPSMKIVMRLAEWGRDPARQETFQRMNKACKVVINEGLRTKLAVGILTTFFFVCPPVCDTYLLTDADQPLAEGVYFAPPSPRAADGEPKNPSAQDAAVEQPEIGNGGVAHAIVADVIQGGPSDSDFDSPVERPQETAEQKARGDCLCIGFGLALMTLGWRWPGLSSAMLLVASTLLMWLVPMVPPRADEPEPEECKPPQLIPMEAVEEKPPQLPAEVQQLRPRRERPPPPPPSMFGECFAGIGKICGF